MSGKVCRLCLRTISNNDYQTVEESLLQTLKLNLKISKESVMCIECAKCLRVFSKRTPRDVYVGEGTFRLSGLHNDVKLDPVKIKATSNLQPAMKTELKCSFCAETHVREDLISLNESKENKFMVNMLGQYISEMILENAGELLTCGTCLVELQGVLNIISKCLEAEQKISNYIELKGTDDEGQIDLKEVQQFTFRPILKLESESAAVNELEGRCDRIKEEYSTMAKVEIKREQEINNTELIIKTEDAHIKSDQIDCDITDMKSEQSDCDGLQAPFVEYQVPNDPLHIPVVTSGPKKCKGDIKQHLLTHKVSSEIKMFRCELCSYEAKQKSTLNRHLLIHKSLSEIKMFKCELCAYEGKRKSYLKVHLLTHKSPSERRLLKCEKIKPFKCALCSYETRRKYDLVRHLLIHKRPSEIEMFKCALCSYEAKCKYRLIQHLLTHKSPSEIKMFKCQLCSYEAKRKTHLERHLLTHNTPSEIKVFKCALCSYEAKCKSALKRHLLTHRSAS